MAFGLLLGIPTAGFVRGECVSVTDAYAVGSYHRPNHGSGDYYYEAGHGSFGEARNYFIFSVPTLSEPPVGAELRVHSSWVSPTNGSVLFQLHQVEAEPVYLILHDLPDYEMIFNDIGEGPVLGSRVISGSEGRRSLYGDPGALLRIPLNTDGLNEIRARQGNWCAFGGAVGVPLTGPAGLVFVNGTPGLYQPQLVLYFSNAGPPEVTYVDPTPTGTVLATDRVTLAAAVCGKTPMTRQWFKDGTQIPGATSETLEIRSMSAADAGTYQLVAANEAGIGAGPLHELSFSPVHIFVETNLYFYEGNDATLYAGFMSRLPLTFQWRKHGTNLFGETEGYLRLPDIRPEDAGKYDVVASNASGSRTSAVIHVSVELRPPFFNDRQPHTNIVAVGVSLDLYNFAQGSPPLQYQWYKDGEPVPGAISNLFRLSSIGFNDAGVYRLVVANAAGSATTDVYHVAVEPIIVGSLYSFSVPWLNPLNYQAYIESSVPWTVQWYFNDEPLPEQTNQMLRIAAFDYVNEGDYFVVARNIYGAATGTVATFTIVTNPPSVWMGTGYSQVWVGDDAEFTGAASGGPPPTLQWLFNGEPLGTPIPNAFGARLELRNVTTNQSGTYALMASNVFGVVISESRTLTVTAEAPFFINVPVETNELAGDIVILRTKAIAGPPPTYQWRKDGVDWPGQTNCSLTLGAVEVGHSGVYEIVARNELGEARHSHILQVSRPTGLDRWSWRLPKPQGSRLYQLTHSDGRYVATGKAGNTITSTDGLNWAGGVIEADTDLNLLAGGNGVFVAAGTYYRPLLRTNEHKLPSSDNRYIFGYSGVLVVSSNGVNWSVGNSPVEDQIWHIAFGNGIFVASGYYSPGFCFTSLDGRNWTSAGYSDQKAYRIIFGNGRFVAQGSDGRLHVSTDGINWTATTPQQTTQLQAFANGRFLAFLDYSGTLSESTDGINWTVLGMRSLIYPWNGIAGGGGVYVGWGYVPAGQVLYSTDAVNWTPVDTGTRQEIESVIYANGQFLAVGEAGMITRSANGLTWTPDEVANKIDFYGITYGQGLHVAAGDAGTILTSSNAVDWTRPITPTTRNLHAVAYANGLFVAGGRGGTLITSPDGVNWTARSSGMTNYVERIAWAEGLWVAAAEGGGISSSGDGLNWSAINTGAPFTDHEGVAHGNGVWVVVGGYFLNPVTESRAVGTLYSSANGLDWTRRGPSAEKRWRDVTFGRGRFVAVGNDGMISFSTNGIDWAVVSFVPYQNLRRIHYANGRFVAVGNDGTLISSPTGVSWTKHRSRNSQNLHDIHLGADGKFIFVGNNGMLLQSGDTRPRFLSITRSGRLEFDSGIATSLRLERSTDLQTWETEAVNVTSPLDAPMSGAQKFWRLTSE